MIEVIHTLEGTKLVHKELSYPGSNSSNHTYCQRRNIRCFMSGETDYKFFPLIKNWQFKEIPTRVKLVVYPYSIHFVEEPIKKIPFPFDTCHFLKLENECFVGFSVYFDYSKWKKKWAAEFYFEQIDNLVEDRKGIITYQPPDTTVYDDMFEYVIEFQIDEASTNKTISCVFEEGLQRLNSLLIEVENKISGIGRLLKICELWKQNSQTENEEFWQSFFVEYSEIVSQTFSSPNLLFQDKAFIGGKNISNKEGKIIDYIFKNDINNNITLIEIKTPNAKLIGKKYRGTYSLSSELSGAINQLLIYRDTAQKDYYSLIGKSKNTFEIFNPKCLLIIGKLSDLNQEELIAFEIFRNELRTIEVITFDELFSKIEILLKLMEGKTK